MLEYEILENNTGFKEFVLTKADGGFYIFKDNNKFAEREPLKIYETYDEVLAFMNGMFYQMTH